MAFDQDICKLLPWMSRPRWALRAEFGGPPENQVQPSHPPQRKLRTAEVEPPRAKSAEAARIWSKRAQSGSKPRFGAHNRHCREGRPNFGGSRPTFGRPPHTASAESGPSLVMLGPVSHPNSTEPGPTRGRTMRDGDDVMCDLDPCAAQHRGGALTSYVRHKSRGNMKPPFARQPMSRRKAVPCSPILLHEVYPAGQAQTCRILRMIALRQGVRSFADPKEFSYATRANQPTKHRPTWVEHKTRFGRHLDTVADSGANLAPASRSIRPTSSQLWSKVASSFPNSETFRDFHKFGPESGDRRLVSPDFMRSTICGEETIDQQDVH